MQKEYDINIEIKMQCENSLYDLLRIQWEYLNKPWPPDNSLDMEKQRGKFGF